MVRTNVVQSVKSLLGRFFLLLQRCVRSVTQGLLALALCFSTGLVADDTDILFSATNRPVNILLLLDTSGSMDELDGGSTTRLYRMQDALDDLITSMDGVNVGVMNFTTGSDGRGTPYTQLRHEVLPLNNRRKQRLKDTIWSFDHWNGTPTVQALWHAHQYYKGELNNPIWRTTNPPYANPISLECHSNHVVLLTDGIPNADSTTEKYLKDNVLGTCDQMGRDRGTCGAELAEYMATTDHQTAFPETKNTVTTHTIGFNFRSDWLKSVSQAGGGGHYEASNSDDLLAAFQAILSGTSTSFAAPTVTVDSYNRRQHRDELYFSLFQPRGSVRWNGNVKKYRLVEGEIVDAAGIPIIENGIIKPKTRSIWSDEDDGGVVAKGGFANKLPRFTNRNWYTDYNRVPGIDGL